MVALAYSWLNINTTADKIDSIVNEESTVYSYKYEKEKLTSIICELGSAGSNFSSTLKIDALGRLMTNEGDTTVENHDVNTYKYDKQNDLVEHSNYQSAAKVEPTVLRFKYDNQRRVIDIGLGAPNGALYQTKTFEYTALDSKKNWAKAIVRFKDHISSKPNIRTDTITRKITYY